MKYLLPTVLAAALMAGCASTRLDDPAPVSQASPATPANAATTAQSSVAAVTAKPSTTGDVAPIGSPRLVYFEYDSAAIRPEFQPVIVSHADYLAHHAGQKITIAGHTDERGGREYNLALGQERAEAVKKALHLLGVRDTQIETVSFGEEKPVSEAHTEDAWSKNRRAELMYR